MAHKAERIELPEDASSDARMVLEFFMNYFNLRHAEMEFEGELVSGLIKRNREKLEDDTQAQVRENVAFGQGKYEGGIQEVDSLRKALEMAVLSVNGRIIDASPGTY